MNTLLQRHLVEIIDLCERFGVESLFAFGSVTTEQFGPLSDVDLLVTFRPMEAVDYVENYFQLVDALESLLHRQVDLVTTSSLQNPYFVSEVNRTKMCIFSGKGFVKLRNT